MNKCKDCKWYVAYQVNGVSGNYGACHRYPPQIDSNAFEAFFPYVDEDNFCGEFNNKG